MRAIVMTAFGGPEVLRLTDIPEPEPEHGQIRVRLYAAGVNPAEAYIRTGQYAFFKPTLPYTPGFDGAGVVDKVGEGVQGSKPGDRVFVTALKPAERILIHGASGGVGTVAVQLARACGAFVIGTAGSPASMELVRSIGAHIVLDHTQPGYLDTLVALTSGVGPDVILEMLADKNLENDMRMIAKHGRIVVIGSRGSLEMTPRLLMAKESVVMGMAIWHSAPEEARMAEAAVAAALRSGALRPVLGDILPLEKAAQAHEDIIARGGKPGKMLLRIE